MGTARIIIKWRLLLDVLHLPEDTIIIDAKIDRSILLDNPNLELIISHPDILVDYVRPRYTTYFNDDGSITKVTFDGWN